MSTQDDIDDALTRHQIFVLRYARGREREAADHVARQLQFVIARLEEEDLTAFSRARLQAQARDLYEYLRASDRDYADSYTEELRRFAQYEAEFNARVGNKHLSVDFSIPSNVQLQQAIFADIMSLEPSRGYTIGSMLDEYSRQGANLVVEQIRDSIVLGDTTQQLTSKIRGLIPTQQRKAATIARTAVNHVSTQARKETAKDNDDILEGYKWVSTLDSLTSLICMSRDGVIYKDFDNDPKPPAHFNCRSTITFKVKPEFDLGADDVGERPSIGPNGTKKVKGDVTYDQWLRRQPKSFQDQVLGKGRAELFRGGLTLDKFVDDRGNTLTLAQLAAADGTFNTGAGDISEILQRLDQDEAATTTPTVPNLTTFSEPRQPSGDVRITPADQVRILEPDQAKTRIKNWIRNNAKDSRHFKYTRFGDRAYMPEGDWRDVDKLDDDLARGFESCIDDMDAICDLFNVPRLKGVVPISSGGSLANMGDATMGINNKLLRRLLLGLNDRTSFTEKRVINQWTKKTRKSAGKAEWQIGRPFTIDEFLDNDYDRARSTFFHELGHHIHQTYKTDPTRRYYGERSTPIELLMATKRGKYTTAKRHSPSRYGDSNTHEWFAENFSAYFMDKRDKVDDLFLELIEDMIRGAYP